MTLDPVPARPAPTPDAVTIPRDALVAIVHRLEQALQRIPLGSASENLDAAYLHVCVAWAHARHAINGRYVPDRPLSDLTPRAPGELIPLPTSPRPCPGCVDRCGQCR